MRVSRYQKLLLENLIEDEVWHFSESNGRERHSLWVMAKMGLVEISEHANPICTPTAKGIDVIK